MADPECENFFFADRGDAKNNFRTPRNESEYLIKCVTPIILKEIKSLLETWVFIFFSKMFRSYAVDESEAQA